MLPDIYKVESIGNGSISVMAKPVTGEWVKDEFSGIAKWGINLIVSLLEKYEAFEIGLEAEKQLSEEFTMEFMQYPIPDRGLPNSIAEYLKFTKRLHDTAADGLNIVVHCRAGIGRTGIIAAGVLLHCGYTPREAIEHVSACRGITIPDTQEQIDWIIKSYAEMQQEKS